MKMIPWNSYNHGIVINYIRRSIAPGYECIETGENWTRNPFRLNVVDYYEGGSSELYTI